MGNKKSNHQVEERLPHQNGKAKVNPRKVSTYVEIYLLVRLISKKKEISWKGFFLHQT
jgi:hypothetical protein